MFPNFVLPEEKGEEHEQPAIMNHPPDINVPLHSVLVTGKPVDPFGN